ncbi:hypothetical protein GCM10027048_08870 [Hymenobacter coalescens]
MKYAACMLVALGGAAPALAQDGGVTFRVDEQVAVWLPAQPQEQNVGQTLKAANSSRQNDPMVHTTQAYRLEDAAALYIIVRIPLGQPPQLPADPQVRTDYYNVRYIPLAMQQARGTLEEQAIDMQPGYDVITLKYRAPTVTGATSTKYLRTTMIGSVMYQLHYIPADGVGDADRVQRERFFGFTTPAAK